MLLLIDNAPSHPMVVEEIYNKVNLSCLLTPANSAGRRLKGDSDAALTI